MRTIPVSTLKLIIGLSKKSQEELMELIESSRLKDNLVVSKSCHVGAVSTRTYNRRIKPIKDLGLIKKVSIVISDSGGKLSFFILNPTKFPPSNPDLSKSLWAGN
jgi:hypothetical protein